VYRLNTDNIDATIDIAKIRGFESLPLRQLEIFDRLALTVSLIGPFQPSGGMRTPGSVRPQAEQAIRQDWGEAQ
jgi:hypothetical protein